MDSLVDDFTDDTNTTGVLDVDSTTTGVIDFEGDRDWFAIELTAGEAIRIGVVGYGPNIYLHDEFGNVVAFGEDDMVGNALTITAEESGTFYLDVFGGLFGTFGDYTLTATTLEDDFTSATNTTGVLEINGTATGTIDFDTDSDWFAIELTAGETIRIDSDGVNAELVLRDALGNSVAYGNYGDNGFFVIGQVEESGTFYVDVGNSFFSPLDYTLTASVIEDDFTSGVDTVGVLEVGGTTTGVIDFKGDSDWFSLTISDADLGLRLTIDNFRLDLSVFDANGNLVTSSTEGRTINFSEVGAYFVAVSELSSGADDYTISSVLVDSVETSRRVSDTGIVDTVVDEENGVTYSLTNDGTLIRDSNLTDTLLPNIDLGVNTSALSLSQDGRYLFAAEADLTNIGNEATVLRIDTETLEVESFSFEVSGSGYKIIDIQAAADGSLFVTTDFPGSGWVPFYNLSGFDTEFSADVVDDPEFLFSEVRQRTTLDISQDGQFLLLAESNISSYPVHIYSVEDGEVIASTNHGGFNRDRNAISGEAELVVVAGTLYDFSFNEVADLTNIYGSSQVEAVFSQNGDYVFLVDEPFSDVSSAAVVSTSSFEIVSFIDLPENISGIVEVDISPDGLSLVVTDESGVHYLDFSETTFSIDLTPEADTYSGNEFDELINGLAGNDILDGAAGDDHLFGGAGNDILIGGDGNDVLNGGGNADALFGGNGDNILNGNSGDDFLNGGVGIDIVNGGRGADAIVGGAGNDILSGAIGEDVIFGGAGDDMVFGNRQNDVLFGDNGNDTVDGGAGNDMVEGGIGNDTLIGGAGQDTLFGQAGDDVLSGSAGGDDLFGGDGNDILNGGGGNDDLYGDAGEDIFVFALPGGVDRIQDFEDGVDLIDLSENSLANDFADVLAAASQFGANVRIELNVNNILILEDFDIADLDATDFIF